MKKIKRLSKIIPIILIVSILFTACDVPDISKFTEQSAEMTRGIRKGVKDSENLIKVSSEREDLFGDATREQLKIELKNYQKALKPTVATLDALDAYLEALNALSQANEKSNENSKALVDSVGSLVGAVSGVQLAASTVNIATGLLTAFEQFRTAKSFEKRVNAAARIVEGQYDEKTKITEVDGKKKEVVVRTKLCTADAKSKIEQATSDLANNLTNALDGIVVKLLADRKISPEQKAELDELSFDKKLIKLKELEKLTKEDVKALEKIRENSDKAVFSLGCGVIDLLKFTIADLKDINANVSQVMFDNLQENNRVVVGFYRSLTSNDERVQKELNYILNYKSLVSLIKEYEIKKASNATILEAKLSLKANLDSIFVFDDQAEQNILQKISVCGANCGNMQGLLTFDKAVQGCTAVCINNPRCDQRKKNCLSSLNRIINEEIDREQFNRSNGLIDSVLEARASVLFEQNSRFLEDLKRIQPSYSAVQIELKTIKDKQNQLDALLNTSMSALDTWVETHANLRVAIKSSNQLTVSKLTSKVREIWEIVNP